jgi:hypothetical protein
MSAWPYVIGRASTGLTGPYAFPSNWTFQRRGELQKTTRRRARHLRMQAGQFLRGQPLYIEAVTPPLKAIRHLLGELAQVVQIHQTFDIGFDRLYAFFPGPTGEAWIDFADPAAILACPREGTALFFMRKRRWFAGWYADLQERALANGRYFPPPTILRVRTRAQGPLRVEIGFAPGFLPGDRLYVLAFDLDSQRGVPYLLAPDEPLPDHPGVRALLRAAAERWRAPGETVCVIGTVFVRDPEALRTLREGVPLEVYQDPADLPWKLAVAWQGRRIGHVWEGTYVLRAKLRMGEWLRLRVIRTNFLRHDFVGRIAFAAYGVQPG